jgi:hypothetical protein
MSDKNEEIVEEVTESTKSIGEKLNDVTEKSIGLLSPITEKVREIVLGFGEIIVTISVIVGLVAALLGGITDMGNLGFFTGFTNMLSQMISVIMGALVIFLLFAIYRKSEKKAKK